MCTTSRTVLHSWNIWNTMKYYYVGCESGNLYLCFYSENQELGFQHFFIGWARKSSGLFYGNFFWAASKIKCIFQSNFQPRTDAPLISLVSVLVLIWQSFVEFFIRNPAVWFQTPVVSYRVCLVWWRHPDMWLSSVRLLPYWLNCRRLHKF